MLRNVFSLTKLIEASRKRIRDRHIDWREKYRERSIGLKKRYEKEVGHGAYYRWEGHDYTTNSDYFIIVGPALTKEGRKSYFAGIKKLPARWTEKKVYAPYGKYFSSIAAALTHAQEMWGIIYPKDQKNFTVSDIANVDVARHLRG